MLDRGLWSNSLVKSWRPGFFEINIKDIIMEIILLLAMIMMSVQGVGIIVTLMQHVLIPKAKAKKFGILFYAIKKTIQKPKMKVVLNVHVTKDSPQLMVT